MPSSGGCGSVLHLAGSHLGMRVHVPLLHTMGVVLADSSYWPVQFTVRLDPWRTVDPAVRFSSLPMFTSGTMHGARHFGTGCDHFPSV